MSVSASELPEHVERSWAGIDEVAAHLRRRLVSGLRRIAFFVIPSVVAFIALGDIIAGAIYQEWKYVSLHADALYVWGISFGRFGRRPASLPHKGGSTHRPFTR